MPDRRKQIAQLIGSRFDLLWFPGGALRTSAGLAPSKRVPCPQCAHLDRPGWLPVKKGGVVKRWDPCTACGGVTGEKPKAGRGVIAVDPMDSTRSTVGSTDTHATARPVRMVRCDSCEGEGAYGNGQRCHHCDGTGRRPLHAFNLALNTHDLDGQADPIDNAIDRRDEIADWHALEKALAQIHHTVNKPLRYLALTLHAKTATDLLDEVHLLELRTYAQLAQFERALYDLAMDYIDSQMPDPIRTPGYLRENERHREHQRAALKGRQVGKKGLATRDNEVKKLLREHPPAIVAEMTGLSPATVYAIRRKTENAA